MPVLAAHITSESKKRGDPGLSDPTAVSAIAEEQDSMSERGNVAAALPGDNGKAAPTDHHLEEVAEMIDQAQADTRSSASPSATARQGCLHSS